MLVALLTVPLPYITESITDNSLNLQDISKNIWTSGRKNAELKHKEIFCSQLLVPSHLLASLTLTRVVFVAALLQSQSRRWEREQDLQTSYLPERIASRGSYIVRTSDYLIIIMSDHNILQSSPQYCPSVDCLPNTTADFQVPDICFFNVMY